MVHDTDQVFFLICNRPDWATFIGRLSKIDWLGLLSLLCLLVNNALAGLIRLRSFGIIVEGPLAGLFDRVFVKLFVSCLHVIKNWIWSILRSFAIFVFVRIIGGNLPGCCWSILNLVSDYGDWIVASRCIVLLSIIRLTCPKGD
jgi:hypothetical protein